MIDIKDKSMCCGCGACAQICPTSSIDMAEDEEGFLYPRVNLSKCIHCSKCETTCPVLNPDIEPDLMKDCYVCYSTDDDIRVNSSSGGVFSLLALQVLDEGGAVYGAAFDGDYSVHHIRIDQRGQLSKIQKSKYLQSRTEDIFVQVKADLQQGKKVLYSGTACQIAGLKHFLGRDFENLITVDVLCHGAPSPKIWKMYLQYALGEKVKSIHSINFRDKKWGWKDFSLEILYDSNRSLLEQHRSNTYMDLFLSDLILRPSCYHCKFKSLDRCSDLTLGDAWGIDKTLPEMDDDKGTSILLIHTDKGREYVNGFADRMKMESALIDSILPPDSDSRKSVTAHPRRARFFQLAQSGGKKAFRYWEIYRHISAVKNKVKQIWIRILHV